MRDLVFVAFLLAFIVAGFRKPFIFVLTYIYIDIVAPQRLTYYLLNSVPISLIVGILAILGWAASADKRDTQFTVRQGLMLLFLIYCGLTTTVADFPEPAAEKWDWVWKALAFAVFLPLTLRTKLRIEALALFVVLSAAAIIIVGGIKTIVSGGGYGVLNLMVANNIGMYESSIISTASICLIPLILYLRKFGTVFPRDWRVDLFCYALIFACLLIPVGTSARTGLICIGVLAVLMLRSVKKRLTYLAVMAAASIVVVPLLPDSFTGRMDTIKSYKADQSASTRIAVWKWTLDFAEDHPFGGGFDAYKSNRIRFETVKEDDVGGQTDVESVVIEDKARAYHSAYFEVLGEQGYPGLLIWLSIHAIGLIRMQAMRRRYIKHEDESRQWIGHFAEALQHGHFIYMVGSIFVGVAYQPFVYILVALEIALEARARVTDPDGQLAAASPSAPAFGGVR